MKNSRYSTKRFSSILLSTILVIGHLITNVSFANSLPDIIHSSPTEAVSSESSYQIKAVVTDDKQVESVILHHRTGTDQQFVSSQMQSQGENVFSFTLDESYLVPPSVEYYIEATDSDGEKQFRGFDFDPLEFSVVAPISGESSVVASMKKLHPAVYVVGALVVVGLAASAFDSDGTTTTSDLAITPRAE